MRLKCIIRDAEGNVIKEIHPIGRPRKGESAKSTGTMQRRFGTAPKKNWKKIFEFTPRITITVEIPMKRRKRGKRKNVQEKS